MHQPDLQPAAAGQRDGVPQPVGEGAAVGQPGERVDERAADQVLLGAAAVGDVDQREDDELRVAVVVPDDLVGLDHPQLGAVGPAQPALAVQSRFGSSAGSPGAASRPRSPTGGSSGWASRSTCRPASSSAVRPVEGAHHRVRHEDVALEVDERLRDGRGEEQGLEELAAVGEQGVDGPQCAARRAAGGARGGRGISEAGRLTGTGSRIGARK